MYFWQADSTVVNHMKGTLNYIYLDLWGSSRDPSKGKESSIFTFKQWKILMENQTGKKIKRLRTDNGLEFCNKEFNDFCKNEGIVQYRTIVGTPQHNGVAKRMNQTHFEKAWCMLSNMGLVKEFETEVINTSCWVVNRSPNMSIECETPEEVWSDKLADYSALWVFGCPVYAHANEGKLEPRWKKCIFLGYASYVKGYHLWCPDPKAPKLIISSDVTFDESVMLKANVMHSFRLKSALKGSRAQDGISPRSCDMHVRWAPDVYDPPVTSSSHTVQKGRPSSSKGKKKGKKKDNNNSRKKKGKKSERKCAIESSRSGSIESSESAIETSGDKTLICESDVKCGSEFLRESLSKMHFSTAEAS